MNQKSEGHPIRVPIADPLTPIESKCPNLRRSLEGWEFRAAEGHKVNEEHANSSMLSRLTVRAVTTALKMELTNQESIDNAYARFLGGRERFHKTIAAQKECFHQVLSYEERFAATNNQNSTARSRLDSLWNMFFEGEDHYQGKFLSYYGQYKLELEAALQSGATEA